MKGTVAGISAKPAHTPVKSRNLYIETYGCAMNLADSEVVASIMGSEGFTTTNELEDADVVFINTCAIRDNAEAKVWGRLREMRASKKRKPGMIVGVLGCMAERLKTQLLEKEQIVDIVVGPDAYRDIPALIVQVEEGQKAVNVLLSREETYAEITPVRLSSNGVTAFVSIMRGCDNMCSFCVVPFTRGRERSRDPESIYKEVLNLYEEGYKEVTLLGQNVDSFKWEQEGSLTGTHFTFANLLEKIAMIGPDLRIRFSSSHPKDITDDVLYAIRKHDNICNYIHYPLQSGSSRILGLMNRTYDRDWFMNRLKRIREIIPDCGISTDVITGFCSETEEDHQETLEMFRWAGFDFAYMYAYSERPGTLAARKFKDDVPAEVKQRRLQEIIDLQSSTSYARNLPDVGRIHKVLIEGYSKRSDSDYRGRNDQNKTVIFPVGESYGKGDYVMVLAEKSTQTSLIGKVVEVLSFKPVELNY